MWSPPRCWALRDPPPWLDVKRVRRLKVLAKTPLGGRRPKDPLSVATLLKVRETLLVADADKARPGIEKAHHPRALRKREARKKKVRVAEAREKREGVRKEKAKLRDPGGLSEARSGRVQYLPWYGRILLAMPERDEVTPEAMAALAGKLAVSWRAVAMRFGWITGRRTDGPVINRRSGYTRRSAATVRLTDRGRQVQAWFWWVTARQMLGWPAPVMGRRTQPSLVESWMVGEMEIEGPVLPWHGYRMGDAADEAWPGFTGSLCSL